MGDRPSLHANIDCCRNLVTSTKCYVKYVHTYVCTCTYLRTYWSPPPSAKYFVLAIGDGSVKSSCSR